MTQLKESILIDAPVHKVFEYISNYRNWPEFYPGISAIKPITEQTIGTGSKFIYKISLAGMTFKVGTEFCDFKKNKGWLGKSFLGVDSETYWNVETHDRKTKFSHGVTYHLPWFMGGKLVDKLFLKSAFLNTVKVSLFNVKNNLEKLGYAH